MESVEGLLANMKLSDAEKRGIRVKVGGSGSRSVKVLQAIGKVLAERPIHAEALEQTLGKVWCPIRGIDCKDLGGNHFLFTFHQDTGKRRAIEDGPWMFGKDLVVVKEFDDKKRLEDMKFDDIPIWIRVSGMPLGMMNKETGVLIGNEVGRFVSMDLDEDGSAVGKFLRIKVRLLITKPLMRGVSLVGDEDDPKLWCPIEYEYLPEFWYYCGIIGHTDKVCPTKVDGGSEHNYPKKLRLIPEKRRWEDGGGWSGGGNGGRRSSSWKSGGSDGWSMGSGKSLKKSSNRSDSDSWKKTEAGSREEPEVVSPLKKFIPPQLRDKEKTKASRSLSMISGTVDQETVTVPDVPATVVLVNPGKTQVASMELDVAKEIGANETPREKEKGGKYKKIQREKVGRSGELAGVVVGEKRLCSDGSREENDREKKSRNAGVSGVGDNSIEAGLANQPCGKQ